MPGTNRHLVQRTLPVGAHSFHLCGDPVPQDMFLYCTLVKVHHHHVLHISQGSINAMFCCGYLGERHVSYAVWRL
jgi:hypothetical protein